VSRASSIVVFSVVSVFVNVSVVCGVAVSRIIKISSSASSEISSVDCVSGCGLRRVGGLAIDVFSVVLVFALVCSVVVIVGSGVWKSPILSWSSSANCGSCCGWQKVEAVAGVSPVVVFSVVALHAVVGVVDCFIVVNIAGELSSASTAASAVICGGG